LFPPPLQSRPLHLFSPNPRKLCVVCGRFGGFRVLQTLWQGRKEGPMTSPFFESLVLKNPFHLESFFFHNVPAHYFVFLFLIFFYRFSTCVCFLVMVLVRSGRFYSSFQCTSPPSESVSTAIAQFIVCNSSHKFGSDCFSCSKAFCLPDAPGGFFSRFFSLPVTCSHPHPNPTPPFSCFS